KLSGESREKLRGQLARIIEFVKQLQSIDTAGIEPRAEAAGLKPALRRGDETKPCLPRDEVLAASPENRKGYFAVPSVIEADEL
ncbi:MAG: Asp-tRNA(Asn)/Glu-tRNA(Gln) amidotransferase subunit GatC, partial [Candidatus Krumholzibacteria bacterium]|nr:Asp-tRNA(Asn)/Glu-tRNA(Gln) amidotransferase subunit GatC [Candidatus Krumholzibacteria bacterium]